MSVRSGVKAVLRATGLLAVARKLRDVLRPGPKITVDTYDHLERRSTDELLAIMRHEAHRIEKSVYNDIFIPKRADYEQRRDRVAAIRQLLQQRGASLDDPTVRWALEIHDAFDDLEASFITPRSRPARDLAPGRAAEMLDLYRRRRSCRVWADRQPSRDELLALARQMVDAARWAPNSGNRQAWRFLVMVDDADKQRLAGLKERHCTSAPLLIFVTMDRRVYGALGSNERSLHVDAGAAVMQMILLAHACGLGTCWNHLATDLIQSRPKNREIYRAFTEAMGIPASLEPIGIVAVGRPRFIPPEPARTDVDALLLGGGASSRRRAAS